LATTASRAALAAARIAGAAAFVFRTSHRTAVLDRTSSSPTVARRACSPIRAAEVRITATSTTTTTTTTKPIASPTYQSE